MHLVETQPKSAGDVLCEGYQSPWMIFWPSPAIPQGLPGRRDSFLSSWFGPFTDHMLIHFLYGTSKAKMLSRSPMIVWAFCAACITLFFLIIIRFTVYICYFICFFWLPLWGIYKDHQTSVEGSFVKAIRPQSSCLLPGSSASVWVRGPCCKLLLPLPPQKMWCACVPLPQGSWSLRCPGVWKPPLIKGSWTYFLSSSEIS